MLEYKGHVFQILQSFYVKRFGQPLHKQNTLHAAEYVAPV